MSYTTEDFFRAFFAPRSSPRGAGVYPAINLYDDGQAFLLRAELPGVEKGNIEITTQGEQVTLRGQRFVEAASPDASYHRRETDGGQFRRSITLPQPIDAEAVQASFKNGVLELVLPRRREVLPRRISVN